MTQDTANQVAARLNEMNVPACDFHDPMGQLIAQWTAQGGRLVVTDGPGGKKRIEFFSMASWINPSCSDHELADALIPDDNTKFGRWSV